MKKISILIALLFTAIYLEAQTKVALIVAIGEYEQGTGWNHISSQNDVPLIKAALIKQGFAEKDILVLKDKDATRDGILNAIHTQLIAKSKKDGIAVFHYSGHGQQIMDDNGDEIDGYDEAIVSYNAKVRYQTGVYTGQNHIRDEELGARMDSLRMKLGPKGNVLVILDACHSGSGTRGGDEVAKHRGTKTPLAPEGYVPTAKSDKSDNNSISSDPNGSAKMAPMVGFFGASPHELNYETEDENHNGVGSLSYAFSRVFSNADKNSSYRGIFDKIKVEMSGFAPKQTPQAEGQLDYKILGGNIVGKQEYYKVDKWSGDKNVTINGGELLGLFVNTKVAFYDIDVKDISKTKPKATGIITSSTLVSADVTLDSPLDKSSALSSWIFVTEKTFGNLEISVKLNVSNEALKKAILAEFANYPFIKEVNEGTPNIIIDEGNTYSRGPGNIKLTSNNDAVILDEAVKSDMTQTVASVIDNIKSFSQANYIRGLDITDSKMDVKFEFIPIEPVAQGDKIKEKSRSDINTKMDAGVLTFKEGDMCKIRITNNGTKILYFTIIDIQPDNKINLIVPNSVNGRFAVDYQIEPGKTKELGDDDIIEFSPPYGNEVYKIIATETPLDLSSIIGTRGEKKGDSNPFSVLFSEAYKETGTRGTKMPNIPQGSANVYSLTFKIVK